MANTFLAYIGGEWIDSSSGGTQDTFNPAHTSQAVATFPPGSVDYVGRVRRNVAGRGSGGPVMRGMGVEGSSRRTVSEVGPLALKGEEGDRARPDYVVGKLRPREGAGGWLIGSP